LTKDSDDGCPRHQDGSAVDLEIALDHNASKS
jgi:hypothetical protein